MILFNHFILLILINFLIELNKLQNTNPGLYKLN